MLAACSMVCIDSQLTVAIFVRDIAAFKNLKLIAHTTLNDLLTTTYQARLWRSQCPFPLLFEVSLPVLKIRRTIGGCHNSFIKVIVVFLYLQIELGQEYWAEIITRISDQT